MQLITAIIGLLSMGLLASMILKVLQLLQEKNPGKTPFLFMIISSLVVGAGATFCILFGIAYFYR